MRCRAWASSRIRYNLANRPSASKSLTQLHNHFQCSEISQRSTGTPQRLATSSQCYVHVKHRRPRDEAFRFSREQSRIPLRVPSPVNRHFLPTPEPTSAIEARSKRAQRAHTAGSSSSSIASFRYIYCGGRHSSLTRCQGHEWPWAGGFCHGQGNIRLVLRHLGRGAE